MTTFDTTYCQASLNYSDAAGYQPRVVAIADGRADPETRDFDRCGFELLQHSSAVVDWRDEQELTRVHLPECERLAADLLGAERTVAYPPLVRSPAAAQTSGDYAPIQFVHSDYSADYRPMIESPERPYRHFVGPLLAARGLTQADVAAAERVVMLQFWRNIGALLPDYPLAFCDAETVPAEQTYGFVVEEYGGMRLEFETICVTPPHEPDEHRWYTFPGMTVDEVVAFRTYDSRCAEEGRPFWTPHSAFRDPHVADPAPRRESLEMRVLCLFGV